MWMIWNPTTKDAVVYSDRAEAEYEARRRGWRVLSADSCTNCGGQKDAEGWCANYCTDDGSEKDYRKSLAKNLTKFSSPFLS